MASNQERGQDLQAKMVPHAGEHVKGRGRVRTVGLDPIAFADVFNSAKQHHTSGAEAIEEQERHYHGGTRSVIDLVDRVDF